MNAPELDGQSTYSSLPIKSLLIFAFTTPPTPKAGTILPILARALTPQSLVTLPNLSPILKLPCRLNRSNPSRCIGVLIICIAAGVRNCAVFIRPDSVDRIRLNLCFTDGGRSASFGARIDGRLKLAKIVMASRAAKRMYESRGMAAAGEEEGLPKRTANWLSL